MPGSHVGVSEIVTGRHPPARSPELLAAARSLLLDRMAAEAVGHLAVAGIPSILLKGPAIATWLYDSGDLRTYRDIDLLVSPSDLERATDALAELGYVHVLEGAHPGEYGPRERDLYGPGNVCIDLHHGLLGATGPMQRCWDVLARHTVRLRVGGADVQVLDLPARTMHLALHAAQNGPVDLKAVADLERGLDRVSREDWWEAGRLAEELGATDAFAAGLRVVPAGASLAEEMSLPTGMTVELALRAGSAPQEAIFFERLANAPGLPAKIALVARKLFPTGTYLRATDPRMATSHGPMPLVLAWFRRAVSLSARMGPALRAWYRARRNMSARERR